MFRFKTVCGCVAALAGFALTSAGWAATINIPASADAFVDGQPSGPDKSNINYGSDGNLYYRFLNSGGTNRNERIYLKFQLPVDLASVTSASISLFKLDSSTAKTVELFGLTDQTLDNWSESTITFANAPAGTDYLTKDPTGTAVTHINNYPASGAANTTFTMPSISDMVNFINADTNGVVTFILSDYDNSFAEGDFASRESTTPGAFAPTLSLTYTQVPEPASAALVLLGGGLLALRRRK